MVRVGEVTDDEAPVALLVDNNQMALHRMNGILRQRGYRVIECEDGDAAVDLFVTEKPDLVFISLDIPTLDGHIAALEMRESRNDARIIFTTPQTAEEGSRAPLSRDVAVCRGSRSNRLRALHDGLPTDLRIPTHFLHPILLWMVPAEPLSGRLVAEESEYPAAQFEGHREPLSGPSGPGHTA